MFTFILVYYSGYQTVCFIRLSIVQGCLWPTYLLNKFELRREKSLTPENPETLFQLRLRYAIHRISL